MRIKSLFCASFLLTAQALMLCCPLSACAQELGDPEPVFTGSEFIYSEGVSTAEAEVSDFAEEEKTSLEEKLSLEEKPPFPEAEADNAGNEQPAVDPGQTAPAPSLNMITAIRVALIAAALLIGFLWRLKSRRIR